MIETCRNCRNIEVGHSRTKRENASEPQLSLLAISQRHSYTLTFFKKHSLIILLIPSSSHSKNLTFLINILLDNDYPLTFIFDTVNQRIKNLIKNRHSIHKDLVDNVSMKESASWLTVPFIPFHTEKFKT